MNWNNYAEIAKKLDEVYPNSRVDALSLSNEELKKMIVSLPGFTGGINDPDIDLHRKFIRNEWVDIRMPRSSTYYIDTKAALDYYYDEYE